MARRRRARKSGGFNPMVALGLLLGAGAVGWFATGGGQGTTEGGIQPPPPAAGSRTAQVAANPNPNAHPQRWCERWFPDEGPAIAPPAEVELALSQGSEWTWVNLWATWCEPCLEEMPLMPRMTEGLPLTLSLVSLDEQRVTVDDWKLQHPNVLPVATQHLGDPAALATWFAAMDLPVPAGLPVHMFADSRGQLRCLRTGGISEEDVVGVRGLIAAAGG